MIFIFSLFRSQILSWVYTKPAQWAVPSWLDNSIGRALHWYCRCQGFKSQASIFFFRLSFCNCVYNCNDHLSCKAQRLWFYNYQILRFLTQTNGKCLTDLALPRFTVSIAKWEYVWIAFTSIVAVLNGIMLPFLESPSDDSPIIVTGMLLGKLNLIAVMETNVAVAQA